jgi:hypothetical protein
MGTANHFLFDPRNLRITIWMSVLLLLLVGQWIVRGIRVKRWMVLPSIM